MQTPAYVPCLCKFIFVGFFMDIGPTLAYDSLGDHVGMLLSKAVVLIAGGSLES
jgi:hypothetical protein